ncbi:DUF6602 domain-containing protein [Orenia marismortui]|uniref:DUF6602 domain-containing protein n=1 Tax=Orenia marismortui TaxID=46469 RepID=A0A4R8GU35_9FIRM|nr:DUF6602 domain-containing protein [Orenia marismortui]TDX48378.1 hypothetical protein C7959_12939 [Orenia marismortui]
MNKVFENLLIEKIENFKLRFSETSKRVFCDEEGKLIHPGEFGSYREAACRDFLKLVVPSSYDISQGFIINTYNNISHQCDIVIYNSEITPLLESNECQRFFPVETVVAIGEIKSKLSKDDFSNAINKLSKVKVLREEIKSPTIIKKDFGTNYDPINDCYDQVFTFLICQELDFNLDNIVNEIDEMYDESVEKRHKHNLILSIKDGLLAYFDGNNKTMMYPFIGGSFLKNRFIQPNQNIYCHFKYFASYLFLATSSGTLLYPEITDYMGSTAGGTNFDENN